MPTWTGDIAKWDENGQLAYIGRIDDQVKVRGHRIEPAEIEAVLYNNSAIERAVVVPVEHEGNTEIAAYYTCKGKNTAKTDIRKKLAEKLPNYMIPTFLVQLKEIPLNQNGKVDKSALPEPKKSSQRPKGKFIPPKNDTEKKIAQIWQKILGIKKISMNDDFFEIGGNSIKAIKVIQEINKAFRISLIMKI